MRKARTQMKRKRMMKRKLESKLIAHLADFCVQTFLNELKPIVNTS